MGEALDEVFFQTGGCPLAEQSAARRANSIANGKNHFKPVVLNFTCDRAATLSLNRCKFCNGSRRVQFPAAEDVLDVLRNDGLIALKEVGKLMRESQTDSPASRTWRRVPPSAV